MYQRTSAWVCMEPNIAEKTGRGPSPNAICMTIANMQAYNAHRYATRDGAFPCVITFNKQETKVS